MATLFSELPGHCVLLCVSEHYITGAIKMYTRGSFFMPGHWLLEGTGHSYDLSLYLLAHVDLFSGHERLVNKWLSVATQMSQYSDFWDYVIFFTNEVSWAMRCDEPWKRDLASLKHPGRYFRQWF